MKGFKVYRDYPRWSETTNGIRTKGLFVDFTNQFTWMPSNDEVLEIVRKLLDEPNQEEFREKLKWILEDYEDGIKER